MVEARRYRRVLRASGLSAREVGRAMNFPANAVERLLAGRVRLLTLPQAEKVEGLVSRRARKWLRGSRRYEGLAAYRLPSALVVPIIEDAYERDGIYAVEGIVGLPQRTLFRIAHDSSGVEFQTTDQDRDRPARSGGMAGGAAARLVLLARQRDDARAVLTAPRARATQVRDRPKG